jgi:cyclic pyranopterin phosphate synthase
MSGGFAAFGSVLHGIDAAIAAGLTPVKINCVVERGVNDHTVLDLIEHFRGRPVIVRFIEFMDVGNRNAWRPQASCPRANSPPASKPAGPCTPSRRTTAAKWRGAGASTTAPARSVSFPRYPSLSAVPAAARACPPKASSTPACSPPKASTCARRCAPAPTMRSCCNVIRGKWLGRTDRYSELRDEKRRTEPHAKKIEMYYIGG